MSQEFFGPKESIKSEFEALRELQQKYELLQKRWSELFDKTQKLDAKYSSDVQFDEKKGFRADRGFYAPKDFAAYEPLRDEMQRVDLEKDILDREILQRRFELGLKYLVNLNQRKDAVWKRISRHEPDPSNPMDILYVEKWRCVLGNTDARVKMTAERRTSFSEGIRKMAQVLEDVEVLERMEHWPKERKLRFNEVTFEFSVGEKTWLKRRAPDWTLPGVSAQKQFDPYDAKRDSWSAHLPISQAYAFPTLSKGELAEAKDEALLLIQKLGTDLT